MDKKSIYGFLITLFIVIVPCFAQEHQSTNDIIARMKTALNLSDDQVANITQIIDKYVDASYDLQKSIDEGTMNQSAIESQKQQIKAAEDQGIAQYLRSDQLSQWRTIESQTGQPKDNGSDSDADANDYSNLPRNIPSQ
jgi:hypothetical protein